ncbi:MAG TPA: c-type cytochrome [Candidatus Angelobacter sp.]|jgi:mono/diheme cytochrome c family protein|nr:c-type cytochrome [Candidatus Angelobacter sp.]
MNMKSLLSALSIITLLLAASVGFAQHENASEAQQSETKFHGRPDEIGKAPEKFKSRPNPFESDPAAVPAGKFLFEEHCSECHGKTADGTRRGPSMMRDRVQTAPSGAIFWLITNGVVRHGMPVWSKLPEPQRWQIISYIKSLGSSTGGAGTSKP